MVDIKKLETAILYIQRIVNGNNPVNNMPLEDDAVLNNQNVTRCMSFVKDVLEEIKKNDGYIGRKPRIKKIDFLFKSWIHLNINLIKLSQNLLNSLMK